MNTECYFQYLPELPLKPDKKENMVMKTYKELLGTCIKSKKADINTVCTKSASKDSPNCFTYLAFQHVKVSMSLACLYLTCTASRSSVTNVQELM